MEKTVPTRPPKKHRAYVLRTCKADLTSYGGFRWPESGYVEAPDWDPEPECGNGLHGALWGIGDGTLLDWTDIAKWLVVEVDLRTVVDLEGKVKFPSGWVVYCGDRKGATDEIQRLGARGPVIGASVTVGDRESAIVGFSGFAMAGNRGNAIAGNRGFATAGNYGNAIAGYHGNATAGGYGNATAGEYGKAAAGYRGVATVGDYGKAVAGEYGKATAGSYGKATAGNRGTAEAGESGVVSAGESGELRISYWYHRPRLAVAYVGEEAQGPLNQPLVIQPNWLYKLEVQTNGEARWLRV